jgi:hypothetical protein
LLTCAFCGQAITGERIRRKLRGGGVREHLYYRCANNEPSPDHPTVRWKSEDLERAIIDEPTFKAKSAELKSESLRIEEALQKAGAGDAERNQRALALFDWSQKAAEVWQGSNNTVRRRILDAVCLNRTLSDVTLVTTKRKPFDQLAERLKNDFSRDDRI